MEEEITIEQGLFGSWLAIVRDRSISWLAFICEDGFVKNHPIKLDGVVFSTREEAETAVAKYNLLKAARVVE